jgi:hypothetical protein
LPLTVEETTMPVSGGFEKDDDALKQSQLASDDDKQGLFRGYFTGGKFAAKRSGDDSREKGFKLSGHTLTITLQCPHLLVGLDDCVLPSEWREPKLVG